MPISGGCLRNSLSRALSGLVDFMDIFFFFFFRVNVLPAPRAQLGVSKVIPFTQFERLIVFGQVRRCVMV